MARQYIWLGESDAINTNGLPKPGFFEETRDGDLWPVIAVESGQLHPGFLFLRQNSLLRSFFELLGFEIDDRREPDASVWLVARFAAFGLTSLPATGNTARMFLLPDPALEFTAENGPEKINYFTGASMFQVANDGEQPVAQLDLFLGPNLDYKSPDVLGSIKMASPIHFRFKWKEARTRILLVELDDSEGEVEKEVERGIGIYSQGVVVSTSSSFNLGFTPENTIYMETACETGGQFKIPVIPDLQVFAAFTLTALDLRFESSGMSLVLGPPISHEVLSVEIGLPLIESAPQSSGGRARVLSPHNALADNYLALKLKVAFGHPAAMRPNAPVDPRHAQLNGPLLVLNARDDKLELNLGGLKTERLGLLAARIESLGIFVDGGIDLPLLASPLGSLGSSNERAKGLLKTLGDSGITEMLKKSWWPGDRIPVPLSLELDLGKKTGKLTFLVTLYIDLWAGRLAEDRAYLYCVPVVDSSVPAVDSTRLAPGVLGRQWVDLGAFGFSLPEHPAPATDGVREIPYPTEQDHDCILDFGSGELTVDFRRRDPSMRIAASEVVIPGMLNLENPNPEELEKKLKSRFRLEMEAFDPDDWSAENPDPSRTIHLRIGPKGLDLAARAIPGSSQTEIAEGVAVDLVDHGEGAGRLVVAKSCVPYGQLYGTMQVPGFKGYTANVSVAVRQDDENKPPRIDVTTELANPKGIADLEFGVLQAQVHRFRADLKWEGFKWEVAIFASFTAWLAESATTPGGLDSLKKRDALRADDVDLLKLLPEKGEIVFRSKDEEDNDQPPNHRSSGSRNAIDFEILEGQFAVRAKELKVAWALSDGKRHIELAMTEAMFEYRNPGTLDVAIEAGSLAIDILQIGTNIDVDLRIPRKLGIHVSIGGTIHCRGSVGWYKDDVERFLGVRGTVDVPSFPQVTAAVKFGVGTKLDGRRAPNVMLFAEYDNEAELFPSVIVKRAGAAIAVNNRPKGFGADPNPDEILKELPTLDVADPFAWRFVREPGTQVMVLMRAMLGSHRGSDTQLFLLETLLTFDSSLAVTAAGKLWLFSTQSFVDSPANKNRPLAVSAAVLSLRKQTFELVAESRPNPAMEKGGQLSKLFDRGRVRMSTYLSDSLVDFYLEEVSYRDNLLGINVSVDGQYRLVAGRFGILNRSSLSFRGDFDRSFDLGVSGFRVSGLLLVAGEFAGLVSERGAASYALIVSELDLRVRGYLVLPGVTFVSTKIRVVIPPVIITTYVLKRKGWRVRWRKKRITLVERMEFERTIQIPMPVMERKYSPEQRLNVSIRGGIGFEESGNVGFSGSLSVVVNVCGFRRRLSAELDYRPDVVKRVRGRTAGIEQRVNQLRGIAARPRIGIPFADAVRRLIDEPPALPPLIGTPEDWIYIRRVRGNRTMHLLIPAPGSRWLVPRHGNVEHYVNLPRSWPINNEEDSKPDETIQTGDEEFSDASILREAVTRLMVRIRDKDDQTRHIELLMPWDRYNLDALSPDASTQALTDATRRLSRIEALMLEGAGDADREALGRAAPAELVCDPRWESDNPILLRPQARNLPSGVKSANWRPPEEVLRDTAGTDPELHERLRAFERLRRLASRQQRKLAVNPEQAERLVDNRANIVALMMQDLEAIGDSPLFGENPGIALVGDDSELNGTGIVSLPRRRRMPVVVSAKDDGAPRKAFKLHVLVLQNCTDLDELLGAAVNPEDSGEPVTLEITAELTSREQVFKLASQDLPVINLPSEEKTLAEANAGWAHELEASEFLLGDDGESPSAFKDRDLLRIELKVKKPENLGDFDDYKDLWICVRFEDPGALTERRLGLLFETEGSDFRVDLANPDSLQVFRRSVTPDKPDGVERVQPLVRVRSFESFQLRNVLFGLEPCQLLLPFETDASNADGSSRQVLQIPLPVRLTRGFVSEHLSSISHFRVYRTVVTDGETAGAVSKMNTDIEHQLVADNVDLCFDHVEDNGQSYLVFNGLLLTDQLIVEHRPKAPPLLFETVVPPGGAGGLIAGREIPFDVTHNRFQYSIRAVRYDDEEASGDARGAMYWEHPVQLHLPPPPLPLPNLALAVQADGLLQGTGATLSIQPLAMALDEEDPGRPGPRMGPAFGLGQQLVEIWAEQEEITSITTSGYYGDESEIGEPAEGAAQRAEDILHMSFPVTSTTRDKTKLGRIPLDRPATLGSGQEADLRYSLKAGLRYRLYTRLVRSGDPEDLNEEAPLAPLPVHLIREEQPDPGSRLPPGRTLLALELISQEDRARALREGNATERNDWLKKGAFTVRRAHIGKYRGIAFDWHGGETAGGIDGGFELVIQDAGEHRAVYRTTSELLSEEDYRGLVRNLRDSARWMIPVRKKLLTKVPWGDTPKQLEEGAILPFYVYAADQNPVVASFVSSREAVLETLHLFVGIDAIEAGGAEQPAGGHLAERLDKLMDLIRRIRALDLSATEVRDDPVEYRRMQIQMRIQQALRSISGALQNRIDLADDLFALDDDGQAPVSHLVSVTQNWFDAVNRHYRSPLSRRLTKDAEKALSQIEQMRLLATYLLLGAKMSEESQLNNLDDDSPDHRNAFLEQYRELVGSENFDRSVGELYTLRHGEEASPPSELADLVDELLKFLGIDDDEPDFETVILDNARFAASRLYFLIADYSKKEGLNEKIEGLAGDTTVSGRIARSVPQAAGLTRVVEALKQDLDARGFRLIRRGHHQVKPDDQAKTLDELLPEGVFSGGQESLEHLNGELVTRPTDVSLTNPKAPAAGRLARNQVVGLLNLLEYLGFALDIAASDKLGRLVAQEQLAELLLAQPWPALLTTAEETAHRAVLVRIRESDGDLSPATAIGPSFLKLLVLPRPLVALLGTDLIGDDLIGDNLSRSALLETWLKVRNVAIGDRKAEKATALADLLQTALKATEGAKEVIEKENQRPLQLFLEEREGLFKSRPIRIDTAYGFWPLAHEAGQELTVGARRDSRYEPLVRWILGREPHRGRTSMPDFIRNLSNADGDPYRFPICFRPLSSVPVVKPANCIPTPDPLHPGFLLRLPLSGERSALSALSRRRTGFVGTDLAFFHKFAAEHRFGESVPETASTPSWIAQIMASSVFGGGASFTIKENQWNTVKQPKVVAVIPYTDPASGEKHYLLGKPTTSIPTVVDGNVTLEFRLAEPVEAEWTANELWFLPGEDHDLFPVLHAIIRLSDKQGELSMPNKQLLVAGSSRPLPVETDTLIGRLVRLKKGNQVWVRVIESLDSSTRSIVLDRPAPEELAKYTEVAIFFGEPAPRVKPLAAEPLNRPTLLRFEEAVIADNLPYHHKYAAQLVHCYLADQAQSAATPDLVESDSSPFVSRKPARLGYRQHLVRRIGDLGQEQYLVTLHACCYGDHLTAKERRSIGARGDFWYRAKKALVDVEDIHLPDLDARYNLYWGIGDGTVVEPLAEITFDPENPLQLKQKWMGRFTGRNDGTGTPLPLRVWWPPGSKTPVYSVELPSYKGLPGEQQPLRLVLQVFRNGEVSPMIEPEVVR